MEAFPEQLGQNYWRDAKLDEGGMGIVYRYRGLLRKYVAVKALPPEFADDPQWRANFLREARTLARLNHPNIAQAYQLHDQDDRTYLIMEYVDGVTLAQLLKRGALELRRALAICIDVAEAISAAHSGTRAILHLDVKPGNIMVTPEDQAKLLDFGLAQRWRTGRTPAAELETATTHLPPLRPRRRDAGDGFRGGTPGYMSPEQYGGSVDPRSDIWSFGCVLFECLTGEAAFRGRDRAERQRATEQDEPRWDLLNLQNERLPQTLRVLLKQCLKKDPEDRPPDMAGVLPVLRSIQTTLLRATALPLHNIPERLEPIVGRDRELAKLKKLLSSNRLVTLHGLGGIGKTRLAIEAGRMIAMEQPKESRRYRDGVWVVELEEVKDEGLLVAQVAQVLVSAGALPPTLRQAPLEAIVESLCQRSVLLILDNCEHLHEACRDLLEPLLRMCEGVDVIATSRHPLEAEGEVIWEVPGLLVPPEGATDLQVIARADAVRLFVNRAERARADFRLTGNNAPHVLEICRRSDGVPLAIMLAAALVRSMDVKEIAAHFDQVLAHRSGLDGRIGGSVALLSTEERALLRRLSVFRGSWEIEAAKAVCGDGGSEKIRSEPVVQLLSRLVDHSLVQFDPDGGEGRYRLLAPVRGYLEKKTVRQSNLDALCARHLKHYCSVAAQAGAMYNSGEQAESLSRFEIEYGNLLAALECCRRTLRIDDGIALVVHLHRFWYVRNRYREGRQWVEHFLAHRDQSDLLQLQAKNVLGMLAAAQGEFAVAELSYARALEIARHLEDQGREAGILTNIGLLHENMAAAAGSSEQGAGHLRLARGNLEPALKLYRQLGDGTGEASCQLNLAVVDKWQRRHDEAEARLKAAKAVFVKGCDDERLAAVYQNLGEIRYRRDDFQQSLTLLKQSLYIFSEPEREDLKNGARALLWLAFALIRVKDCWTGAVLLSAAETLRMKVDAPAYLVDTDELVKVQQALEQHLDASRRQQARDLGPSMSFEQAMAFALDRLSSSAAA